MAKASIRWIVPPDKLAANIEAYGDRVVTAIEAVAQYIATEAENYARTNASWTDRTENARQSLKAATEVAKDIVTIYLVTGMNYGKWLELCNSGKYAIILPTLEAHYPQIMRQLRRWIGSTLK